MSRIITIFVIYFSCFQMAFGESISRIPANDFGHEIDLVTLKEKMQLFSDQINGKDLKSDCATNALETAVSEEGQLSSSETKVDEWEKYLITLKKNSCGQYAYSWDSSTPAEEVTDCKPVRQKGMIEKIAERTIQEEVDEKPLTSFKRNDKKIRELHKRAEYFQEEVRKYLVDSSVKLEERQNLLLDYIDQVVLSLRDLIVIRRAYVQGEYDGIQYYESLLPDFPTELYAENKEMMDKLNLGKDPKSRPFHLKVEERKWGRSRLRFRRNEVISRDIMTLMKAPTTKNYVRSLKWMTLHMMLSQIFTYDTMLGEKTPLKVPKSCQSHMNGDFPDTFKFDFVEGQGDEFIDNLLAGHGLIFSKDNQFYDYYMYSIDKDPTEDGYSGLMPFEQYKYAKLALDESSGINPDIDDITHFDAALNLKMGAAVSVFKKSSSTYLGLKDEKKYTHKGLSFFEKIVTRPSKDDFYEVADKDGETIEINSERQNLSVFLAELMVKKNVVHYEDLITSEMKAKLEKTRLRIDMPSLYGPAVWRAWALRSLGDWAIEANARELTARGPEARAIVFACSGVGSNKICDNKSLKARLKKLVETLGPYAVIDSHIPLRRLKEDKISDLYPMLEILWESLRDRTQRLEVAKPTEYNFLLNQMSALNPWARVRLSYLLAMEELSNFKNGYEPKYTTASNGRKLGDYSQSVCFSRNMNSAESKIREAGRELGIDRPLVPNYANKILDEDEKKYIWQEYLDSADDSNSQLFKVSSSGDKSYYDVLEKVSYQTFLTKDEVESFIQTDLPLGASLNLQREIEKIASAEEAKLGDFFKGLYDMKGNPEGQAEIFEAFSEENGIDNEFKAKLNFLSLDNSYKRPIYKEMIRESARKRKNLVRAQLNEFCELEDDDHERRKTLFYMTSKHQNQLNQMAGLPAIPEKVLDEINSMSPAEWVDLQLGLGAGLLGVAAILIGGACTGLTGGLCAPLGIGIMAMGASAITMQVTLVGREFERKKEANVYAAKVKTFEKLGYAVKGSDDSLGRTWFWAAFELASIIPLIGVVSRTAQMGTRMSYVATKTFMRNSGKASFKNAWGASGRAGKLAMKEIDVKYARFILGFDDISQELARLGSNSKDALRVIENFSKQLLKSEIPKDKIAKAIAELRKLHFLKRTGKISAASFSKGYSKTISGLKGLGKEAATRASKETAEYTSKVSVKQSVKEINQKTAQVVARYWGNNPKAFKYLMSTYSKKLDKAAKVIKMLEETKPFKIKEVPLLGRIPLLNKVSLVHLGPSKFGKVPLIGPLWNAIKKMRLSHLNEYAAKIKNIEAGLEGIAKNGGRLDNFIYANMNDLTDIFMKIPMRRREIPYVFLLQGGPHMGGIVKGARVPVLYGLGDGIIMRKFFNARARLVYESAKAQARTSLGMTQYLAAETTFGAFRQFQNTVATAAESMTQEKGTKLIKEYGKLEEKIIEKISVKLAESGKEAKFKINNKTIILTPDNFRQVLFYPASIDEKAVAETVWKSVDVDDLFDMKEMGALAHRVVQELSDYKGMNQFDDFLKALKILVIHRDPGVVEIM